MKQLERRMLVKKLQKLSADLKLSSGKINQIAKEYMIKYQVSISVAFDMIRKNAEKKVK
jgi:hypothetical protein